MKPWNLWWRPKPSHLSRPSPSLPPSPAQVEFCLDLIRRHPSSGPDEMQDPFFARTLRNEDPLVIVIEFMNPETLPMGSIYKSWAVFLPERTEPKVAYIRSRRGPNGFETLPPD